MRDLLSLRRPLTVGRRLPAAAAPLTAGALGAALLLPALALAHALLVLGAAALLRSVSDADFWPAVIARFPVDPVYTLALVHFAGEIEARGVAVAPPLGGLLHALAPGLFAPTPPATGAWTSVLLAPGATVIARGLARFAADLAILALGVVLFTLGLRRRRWLAVCGALAQAQVVRHYLLGGSVQLRDLEAAGLPFAVSTLISGPNQRAPWFTTTLERLPAPLVGALLDGLLVLLAYLAVAGLLVPAWLVWRAARGGPRPRLWRFGVRIRPRRLSVAALGTVMLVLTPWGATAVDEPRVLEASWSSAAAPAGSSAPRAVPGASGPAVVSFSGGNYQYTLLVNGTPRLVRGMGYNVQYGGLSPAERARRYDRDFSLMRQSGVNAVFGWFQDQFDSLMLDKAHEYGLGVGLPYELNQDLNYDDPAVRAQITADVLEWVARYKDHPALWFWTPGNEVVHRLIFPTWLKRQADPAREARADSFARFYVELIDQIHALDPNHPIIYRDAEDLYLGRIRAALQRDGKPRPWFAYGANVYSRRLDDILRAWPQQGLDAPLFVSEFSPGGTGPADRPQGLRSMWTTIRRYPAWVIGGAVYTWTTDGPEELDRVFGLVDGNGHPTDGSLAAVAELFTAEGTP